MLATFLNVYFVTFLGFVRTIKADCFQNTSNDTGLRKVVEKWLGRTTRDNRKWQTLLETAENLDDYELSKYLKNNNISSKQILL